MVKHPDFKKEMDEKKLLALIRISKELNDSLASIVSSELAEEFLKHSR